jgi:glycosyltransferase involved in cell wall biosynthesis
MRIAIVHTRYRQPGGEDVVVEQETRLLRNHGHEVVRFLRNNSSIAGEGSARVALDAIWSRRAAADLEAFLLAERPDVVHVHNTFPLLSPAVFHVARRLGIPGILTLHNFRLLCPSATLFRNGEPCEDCVSRPVAFPALRHRCYRDSRSATAAVVAMNAVHGLLGTWRDKVAAFVALTHFARDRFVAAGLPPERLHVRPNYVADPGLRAESTGSLGARPMYLGRVSEEKGVRVLLEAWREVDTILDVYGTGPLLKELREDAPPNIRFHGAVTRERASLALSEAAFLVVPSIWYEAFPLVVLEAYSLGLPVLASRLGSLSEVVIGGETGVHFSPGRPEELASAARNLLTNPDLRVALGKGARSVYEERYTPEHAYSRLLEIYGAAGAVSGGS